MIKTAFILISFLFLPAAICSGQVSVRLFAALQSGSVTFSVKEGSYELHTFNDEPVKLEEGSLIVISRYGEKLVVKSLDYRGFLCDSLLLKSSAVSDVFSLRVNGQSPVRRYYKGDLKCIPDLGTLVPINICDTETYIAGVVRAEGGEKRAPEYYKTLAVIVRTYMYRHFARHAADHYNLCDNTHCQVYNGITTDSIIIRAALETHSLVILGSDSTLINSAFHSNCGGETASSEDVWLTAEPYLRSVTDEYCRSSRNAVWQKSIAREDWINFLEKSGYKGSRDNPGLLNISQQKRVKELSIGTFPVPVRQVREDFNLRSAFFSVEAKGDSVILNGRGYGHGVGLCQEGAMVMVSKGFDFRQIISFYYTGVRIADIKDAVPVKDH